MGAFIRLEVAPGSKSEHPGCDHRGEAAHGGVDLFHRGIVIHPRHGNPVFRAGQLILQLAEIGIRFQVRIIFNNGQQPGKGAGQLPGGGSSGFGVGQGPGQLCAGRTDAFKDLLFVFLSFQ